MNNSGTTDFVTVVQLYFPGGGTGGLTGSVGLSPPRSLFIDSSFNLDSKNFEIVKSDFFMINDLIYFPTLF
jgi:hypothetical protein